MNILFLTLARIHSIAERGIYTDLLCKFRDMGHNVIVLTPVERRLRLKTNIKEIEGVKLLQVKTLNITKSHFIEKGIATLAIEYQYLAAIKRYLSGTKFDLVLYSTPPITFEKVIRYIKSRDNAFTYLLLKDIFPQNAVDLNMISNGGILHRYFRKKEKALYAVSDIIGCMSPANVEYVCRYNEDINPSDVEVCPNSIAVTNDPALTAAEKSTIREKYKLPLEDTLFIYGGNLGKPQGLSFLTDVLEAHKDTKGAYFVVIGSGTEFSMLQKWFETNNPSNAILIKGLPKAEYDELVQACDVGLIFLDHKFTIPNYPSRLLSYLEYRIPVITATDTNSDIGSIAVENGYGFWSQHGQLSEINKHIGFLTGNKSEIRAMGERGYQYLLSHYTVDSAYAIIIKHFKNHKTNIS